MANSAFVIQKDVGTSSLEKVVEYLDKMQRANPLCTTLQLNYMAGGPIEHELPPLGHKCYTGEMTDYLLQNQKNKNFFLVSKQHLREIVKRNIVKQDSPFMAKLDREEYDSHYILFKSCSFLNHSCIPNTFRSYFREDSSVVFVKAIRDIEKDEEITVCYTNPLFTLQMRQDALQLLYSFECKCERCQFEDKHKEYFQ